MTTSRVVALCLCLLLAPVAQAQTSGLVNTIIHGCTSGWTSGLCHAALNRASGLCKGQGNKGNCAQLFSELCQKNKVVCEKASGPLCGATGSYAGQCKLAVKAVASPVGGLATKVLGGH